MGLWSGGSFSIGRIRLRKITPGAWKADKNSRGKRLFILVEREKIHKAFWFIEL